MGSSGNNSSSIQDTNSVPGSVLRTLHGLIHLNCTVAHQEVSVVIPILYIRKPRHGEVKQLAPRSRSPEWLSQKLNPDNVAAQESVSHCAMLPGMNAADRRN